MGGGGPGQSLLAFHKKTGQVVWKDHDEIITHATPVVATILGERQVIFFLKSGLLAVSAKDGKALWRSPSSSTSRRQLPRSCPETLSTARWAMTSAVVPARLLGRRSVHGDGTLQDLRQP